MNAERVTVKVKVSTLAKLQFSSSLTILIPTDAAISLQYAVVRHADEVNNAVMFIRPQHLQDQGQGHNQECQKMPQQSSD